MLLHWFRGLTAGPITLEMHETTHVFPLNSHRAAGCREGFGEQFFMRHLNSIAASRQLIILKESGLLAVTWISYS